VNQAPGARAVGPPGRSVATINLLRGAVYAAVLGVALTLVSSGHVLAGQVTVDGATLLPPFADEPLGLPPELGAVLDVAAAVAPITNIGHVPFGSNTYQASGPSIDIQARTNGAQADDSGGEDVPEIAPGATVRWRYVVSNTGVVSIPRADIIVTDSVIGGSPTFLAGLGNDDGDDLLAPGERWIYEFVGTALDLNDPANSGLVVAGCLDSQGRPRNTYENIGTVTIPGDSDADPSHYCNPAPSIDIQTRTNGAQADDSGGEDVPEIAPGRTVRWRYYVRNTGVVSIPRADITVTDSVIGGSPTFLPGLGNDDGDDLLAPGELWIYEFVGTALDLNDPANADVVVDGCLDSQGRPRNTYENIGTVTIPGDSDADPSHYCNPEPEFSFIKKVNGDDANDVMTAPEVSPPAQTTFSYEVTNTGVVAIAQADITVTDSVLGDISVGGAPADGDGDGDGLLDTTETWIYQISVPALDLYDEANQQFIVTGCDPNDSGDERPTYRNEGSVTIGGTILTDPAHYCNGRPEQAVLFGGIPFGVVNVVALLMALTLIVVPLVVRYAPNRNWFHPAALPTLFIAIVLLVPSTYAYFANRRVGQLQPADLDGRLALSSLVVIAAILGGIIVALRIGNAPAESAPRRVDAVRLLWTGRAVLIALVPMAIWLFVRSRGERYGADQFVYGSESFLETVVGVALLPAVAVVAVANVRLRSRLLALPDLGLVAATVALMLASGDRSAVVAPLIFLLWARHSYVRRFTGTAVVVGFTVLALTMAAVAGLRHSGGQGRGLEAVTPGYLAARTVGSISSPLVAMSDVLDRVPSDTGFYRGSTYAAAVKYLPPGPLSRSLFGDEPGTGTFVYHDLIDWDDPDNARGFAFTAEAYLNFGWPGLVLLPLLLGALLGYAWRRHSTTPHRARHLFYPVLVAALPLALRSDALGQLKGVGYAMAGIFVAFLVSRSRETSDMLATKGEP
jgi:hypothetical protein